MATVDVNALVSTWNTNASLNLTAEQEQNLQALLTVAVQSTTNRKAALQQVVENLQAAVQGDDSAAVEQLLQQVRQGLVQAGEAREKFLDKLDETLQPGQRAKLVLSLAKQAQESGQPVEQVVTNLLSQSAQ